MEDYVPRLSVEITPEQHRKLQSLLPHGLRKIIFGIIVEDLIELLSVDRAQTERVLGAFVSRSIDMRQLKTLQSENYGMARDNEEKSARNDTAGASGDSKGKSPSP